MDERIVATMLRNLSLSECSELDACDGAKRDVKGKMRRVVGELESVLGELKTVVGDLQTLVSQIDVVTTQIDRQCTPTGDDDAADDAGNIWRKRQMSAPLLDPPPILQPCAPTPTPAITRSASHSANFFRPTCSSAEVSRNTQKQRLATLKDTLESVSRVHAIFSKERKSSAQSDSAPFFTSTDLQRFSGVDPWTENASHINAKVIKKSRHRVTSSSKENIAHAWETSKKHDDRRPPSHRNHGYQPSILLVDHRGNNPKYYEHLAAEFRKSKSTKSAISSTEDTKKDLSEESSIPTSSTEGEMVLHEESSSSTTEPSPVVEYDGLYEKELDDCLEFGDDVYSSIESLPLGMEAQDTQSKGFYYTSAEDSGLCQLQSESLSEDQFTSNDDYSDGYEDNDGDDEGDYDIDEGDWKAALEHRSSHHRNIIPKALCPVKHLLFLIAETAINHVPVAMLEI
ncbi:hypothetical protein CAPTEDRAFT_208617 [Capitella teleta]|uniref:Uncharacterized protein n=1 Tax=Capitella teleta TaxID=283909 RepID=R7URH4_CAPTE|nr:hypothetical protein CAPTEDRAFT_208617 [Capitella teleta]|eukprot:ELU06006.1 hypothetical protein CAPTEDRAFT_208617 [Capitella teleta]